MMRKQGARGAWQSSPIEPGLSPLGPVLHYSMRSRRPRRELRLSPVFARNPQKRRTRRWDTRGLLD